VTDVVERPGLAGGREAESTRSSVLTVGVDIGGTSVKAGLVTAGGEVLARATAPTARSSAGLDDAVARVVHELTATAAILEVGTVRAVGLAVAGFITADRSAVMFAPHLPWRDREAPVATPERLATLLGLPVVMDHDVNAAAVAEHRIGAAAGYRVALLIALGTGIGAGLIVGNELFRGGFGVAPELGHLVLVPGGRVCPCGKSGCWERYCSGTALARTAAELGMPGTPTGADVGRAALVGDRVALAAVADLGSWLARGLAIAADVFDPEVIVVGGGVSAIFDLILPVVDRELAGLVTGGGHRPLPAVVAAALHESASVVGGGLLAHDAIEA
jgi:glucokinase